MNEEEIDEMFKCLWRLEAALDNERKSCTYGCHYNPHTNEWEYCDGYEDTYRMIARCKAALYRMES